MEVKEFIGLGPKMYCVNVKKGDKEEYIVKGKGIAKVVLKSLVFKDFSNVLVRRDFEQVENDYTKEIICIQSKKHTLRTVRMHKVTLSAADNKRYILSDGIHSLAYGHCYIEKLEKGEITEEEVLVKLGYTDRYIDI